MLIDQIRWGVIRFRRFSVQLALPFVAVMTQILTSSWQACRPNVNRPALGGSADVSDRGRFKAISHVMMEFAVPRVYWRIPVTCSRTIHLYRFVDSTVYIYFHVRVELSGGIQVVSTLELLINCFNKTF